MWLYSRLKNSWTKPPQLSSSTYSISATVLYTSSFFCSLYLPLLFLCVLHPILLLYRDLHHLLYWFPFSSSLNLLFKHCSVSPLLFCTSFTLLALPTPAFQCPVPPCSSSWYSTSLSLPPPRLRPAADRCAFHTLFVSLFCHSTELQRSSLIIPVSVSPGWCFPQPKGSAPRLRISGAQRDGGVRSVQTHKLLNLDCKLCTATQVSSEY